MTDTFLAKNLKLLIKNYHVTVLAISREINVPQPTLHHILSGITRKPRLEVIKKLAQYFNVSVHTLLHEELRNELVAFKPIPLFIWDKVEKCFKEQRLSDTMILDKYQEQRFAFLINKDNCYSSFPDKSIVVLSKDKPLQEGQYGLIFLKDYGLILNKVYKEKATFFIRHNNSSEDIRLLKINLEQDRWLGAVLELRLIGQATIDNYLLNNI
ncbi:helix-turn-helix domain-containing protein [Legionella gresilensis]|uniref:helix-turn-helix domain-containing protein n=1 Tax=Legionella gresilensis TaxID=91823 RepID=UPI0013EF950C|nr:helix-turn-helix transcriptional regulator [Legionella gresilensis]